MLNLDGFYPVAQKNNPGNYGVKYRCKPLENGGFEYRFLFSQQTMKEQGWKCGDYVSVGYDSDEEVVGFAKAEAGEMFVRKLRRKDASRTGCFIAMRGELGFPVAESAEVAIVTDEYEPHIPTLLVRLPGGSNV